MQKVPTDLNSMSQAQLTKWALLCIVNQFSMRVQMRGETTQRWQITSSCPACKCWTPRSGPLKARCRPAIEPEPALR